MGKTNKRMFRYLEWMRGDFRPLGRWMQCGEKKTIENVLEWKTHQKKHRQFLVENGIDPYLLYKKEDGKAFVFDLKMDSWIKKERKKKDEGK